MHWGPATILTYHLIIGRESGWNDTDWSLNQSRDSIHAEFSREIQYEGEDFHSDMLGAESYCLSNGQWVVPCLSH